jgi:MATE family multidrug resistance protein
MNRRILRLALPNILSNLSVPLLGMVDTALMGRQDSPAYLGAVALGSLVFNFLYWGMGFLRMGTTGLTAQAYGQKDGRSQLRLLLQALLVAGLAGTLFVVLQVPIERLSFWLIPGEAEVITLAREYVYVRIWAAPATIGLYVFHGWFLGMQNARIPLMLAVVGNALNVGLNLYFVNELGMKADGVALATVMAQYATLLLAMGSWWVRYRTLLQHWAKLELFEAASLRRFFAVNGDIFLRTIALIFAFSFFTASSSGIDPLVLAANQILLQYLHLMAFGVDGFAFAAESLVGRMVGAKDARGLRRVIKLLFRWGMGLGLLFSLGYLLAGEWLLGLFTDQAAILAVARGYLGWMVILPLCGAYAYLWDGIYFGATATRPMRNAMLLVTGLVYLPLALAADWWGNHALWLAMTLFMLARGLALHALAGRQVYRPIERLDPTGDDVNLVTREK